MDLSGNRTTFSVAQWLITLCLINLYACKWINQKERTETIKLHHLSAIETSISQMGVSQITEVSMICPDTVPFYVEDKVCITNSNIFIQDKLSGTILVFNKDGGIISTIKSHQGKLVAKLAKSRGDHKGLTILDYGNKNICFYNEHFKLESTATLNPYCLEIAALPDLSYYLYFPDITSIQNNGFSFQYVSDMNNKKYFLKSHCQENGFINFFSLHFLGDILVFWEYDRNRVYHISPDNNIVEKYKLDLGNDKLSFKDINTSIDLYSKSLTSLSVTRLIESKNHVFFESVNNGMVEFLIYDKSLKKSWEIEFPHGYSSPGIIDDLNGGIPFIPEGVDYRGNLYSFVLPHEIQESKQNITGTKLIGVLRICDYERK